MVKICPEGFQCTQNTIATTPVLAQLDPERKIYVSTDANKFSSGAVMEQYHEDGRHPVAFISRTSNPHEQNYAAHNLEIVGIVGTLKTWRYYLHGQKFIVHSTHHPLKQLETQEFLTPRQVR